MVIVGIDPGAQRAGFAVLEWEPRLSSRGQLKVCELGVWNLLEIEDDLANENAHPGLAAFGTAAVTTSSKSKSKRPRPSLGTRLELLFDEATALFRRYNPSFIGLEKAVSFKNVASAHKLSEARGVIRLAAHRNLSSAERRLYEISPTAVKRQSSGFGLSNKQGIVKALSLRFPNIQEFIDKKEFSFDAYDALAVAWTTWVQVKVSQNGRPSARDLKKRLLEQIQESK